MSSTNSNPSMASLLRNRFIQTIMTAGLFIQVGMWIRNFAILLFVTEKTMGMRLPSHSYRWPNLHRFLSSPLLAVRSQTVGGQDER
jgi:hypothetical protein